MTNLATQSNNFWSLFRLNLYWVILCKTQTTIFQFSQPIERNLVKQNSSFFHYDFFFFWFCTVSVWLLFFVSFRFCYEILAIINLFGAANNRNENQYKRNALKNIAFDVQSGTQPFLKTRSKKKKKQQQQRCAFISLHFVWKWSDWTVYFILAREKKTRKTTAKFAFPPSKFNYIFYKQQCQPTTTTKSCKGQTQK